MWREKTPLAIAGFGDSEEMSQGSWQLLETGKGKWVLFQSLRKGRQPCQHLGVSPVRARGTSPLQNVS